MSFQKTWGISLELGKESCRHAKTIDHQLTVLNPKKMQNRRLILFGSLFFVFAVASSLLMGVPMFGPLLMAAAVVSFLLMGWALLSERSGKRYRDEYDLELLKDIHEQKEIDKIDHVAADADVVCPHCGSVYGSVFKVCPHCRRSP